MDEKKQESQVTETVIVTIRSEDLAQIDDVAEKLRAAGLMVDNVLKSLGQVTGTTTAEHVDALRQVEKVESVSPQRTMRIAPPDSDVQ